MIAAISGRSQQPTSMAKRCSATGLWTKWEECINSQELFRKKYLADVWPKALQKYLPALGAFQTKEPLSNSSILKETGIPVCTGHRCSQGSLPPCRNPPFTRISQTLRPGHCQSLAVQVQVHQREAGAQPMMVLAESSVSHLLKAKDALQNPKRMFYFRSYSRLHPVLGLL